MKFMIVRVPGIEHHLEVIYPEEFQPVHFEWFITQYINQYFCIGEKSRVVFGGTKRNALRTQEETPNSKS